MSRLPSLPNLRRWMSDLAAPGSSPEIETAMAARRARVPVLWLLGKTGAGKSSVVQRLTGDSRAEIGNGFEPCTRTADLYDHPQDAPVMRFLDTRGLGEADYDPGEDLAACRGASHALLVLTRIDDVEQSSLVRALEDLGKAARGLAIVHLHTALHAVPDPADRRRAVAHNARLVAEALGRTVPAVELDFTDPDDGFDDADVGLPALRTVLIDLVPALEEALARRDASDGEQAAFLTNRREVIGYASAAAAVDALPGLGLVGVPTVQGKMLHALAARYGYDWNRGVAREFLTALGTTFLYRYLVSFLAREVAKFIPVYGQTAGAATAATLSFASTYAIGRAACMYLHARVAGEHAETADLQAAFRAAFTTRHVDPADGVPRPDAVETERRAGAAAGARSDDVAPVPDDVAPVPDDVSPVPADGAAPDADGPGR